MYILGIESSCDETAVGIVDEKRSILADVVASQIEAHRPYGGVVPEIAARAHLEKADLLINEALAQAGLQLSDLSAIAATCGPGLIGGVMVGEMTGKALAAALSLPFLPINHIEAHALTARLTHDVAFPYLLLLASGGHSQLVLVKDIGVYQRLGGTIDDAMGECFDKSAKLLGLGYPGGPLIEKAAQQGNPKAFAFPRPLVGRAGCDFSFSGLKTALRQAVDAAEKEGRALPVADLAASLQAAIGDSVADRTQHAFALCDRMPTCLVAAGGVAANSAIRQRLTEIAARHGVPFMAPPPSLCTDNGVMIAWAGMERFRRGAVGDLAFRARPRWPLDEMSPLSSAPARV